MYVITDYTRPVPYEMISVDAKDIRDIVIGICNNIDVANKYYKEVCDMHFGDEIIANPFFAIKCVLDCEI